MGARPRGDHARARSLGLPWRAQDTLVNGPLGKSGFLAAFSLIFVSEIGDKTFFIAALLAMKLGKWLSFAGSLASLAVMTIISVAIGVVIGKASGRLGACHPSPRARPAVDL